MVALLVLGNFVACKEKDTLADAQEVYISLTPDPKQNLITLAVAVDTIDMKATVKNVSGREISDAVVTWSSDDETIVKFINGNRLVAVSGGEGKSTTIRATLQNGKYAVANVSVSGNNAGTVTLMTSNKDVVDGIVYLAKGSSMHLLIRTQPASLLKEYTPVFEAVDASMISIQPRAFAESDTQTQKETPAGGMWYTIIPEASAQGTTKFTYKVGKLSKQITLHIGTIIEEVKVGDGYELVDYNKAVFAEANSRPINIGSTSKVIFRVKSSPSSEDALPDFKDEFTWTTEGSGGIITSTATSYDTGYFYFTANVSLASLPGTFTVHGSVRGIKASYTFNVEDFAKKEFTDLKFGKMTSVELQSGEYKPLTLVVYPRASQLVILSDIDNMYRFSTPDIAEFRNEKGSYQLVGKSAGETELIITVRDREFRLPIKVIPAPISVLINTTTPEGVMVGDILTWTTNVVMAGSDLPVYENLVWTSANSAVAEIKGSKRGQSVRIEGKAVTEETKVLITADYRGKSNTREIIVVPAKTSTVLANSSVGSDSGLKDSTFELVLPPSAEAPADAPNRIKIKTAAGANMSYSSPGTYSASNYTIETTWGRLTKNASSGTVKIDDAGGDKVNVTLDLTYTLANGTSFTVKGTLTDLKMVD